MFPASVDLPKGFVGLASLGLHHNLGSYSYHAVAPFTDEETERKEGAVVSEVTEQFRDGTGARHTPDLTPSPRPSALPTAAPSQGDPRNGGGQEALSAPFLGAPNPHPPANDYR